MSPLVFALPGNEALAEALGEGAGAPGQLEIRRFPDEELYLRVHTPVRDRDVILACTLDRPDAKLFTLYHLARTLRELGARRIVLVAPYLGYMRQDCAFHPGEAVTSRFTAQWISSFVDGLVTVDPHLHRIHRLDEVFGIPAQALAAGPLIAGWIRASVARPFLIGPDAESEQWIVRTAQAVGCPGCVLSKVRHGDRDVEVTLPAGVVPPDRTPVLLDDVISTGQTMIAAVRQLRGSRPVCVATHAVFAGEAYAELRRAGAQRIVTTSTIAHPSNGIDAGPLLRDGVRGLLDSIRADHAGAVLQPRDPAG